MCQENTSTVCVYKLDFQLLQKVLKAHSIGGLFAVIGSEVNYSTSMYDVLISTAPVSKEEFTWSENISLLWLIKCISHSIVKELDSHGST